MLVEPKETHNTNGLPANAPGQDDENDYVVQLYIAGHSLRSIQAIASVRSICEKYLSGRYELQIIDIYQQTKLAEHENVVVVPTLIKIRPLPPRRLVGDLTDEEKVLSVLELTASTD